MMEFFLEDIEKGKFNYNYTDKLRFIEGTL